ncbi:MAG: hypothetical protein JSV24_10280, partial [Bacteroidales bacterium]
MIKKFPNPFIVLIPFLLLISCSEVRHDTFPGETWEKAGKPEDLNYSAEKLAEAKRYCEGINTAAVVIVAGGRIVDEWGEVERKFMTHSIRKSFLSALYGNYIDKGIINPDLTLE